jgi:hypothetical protein
MNLDNLLRESDPVREISIPIPDVTNARAISRSTDARHLNTGSWTRGAARHRPLVATISIALSVAVIALVAVTVLSGGTGLSGPVHTPWRAARALPGSITHVTAPAGTFVLADYITTASWQQNITGPEPGYLTCPTSLTCYVTGDSTVSSSGPTVFGTLYVSNDGALDWSVLPLPAGVDFTTPLTCSSADECAAGATDKSQPVFVSTVDGGHSFTINPLPSADGRLYSLSCPSTGFCAGLAGTSADANLTPIDATFLSTTDGGLTFSDSSLPAGDSMESLDCPTATTCVAVGTSDQLGINDWSSGVVASTSNSGASWTSGALPEGFGINYLSRLTCVDAENCSLIGLIAIAQDFPGCAGGIPPSSSTPMAPQSAAVQAISGEESAWATAANEKMKSEGFGYECGSSSYSYVNDIASTSNAGLTWTPEALPSTAPNPQLSDIACSSDQNCVASGSVEIPQTFGANRFNASSAAMLVTNDGGASWTKVSFAVPSTVPSGVQIDAFMAVGDIQCPQANDCVALGVSDQGSKTTPVYTSSSTPQSTAS